MRNIAIYLTYLGTAYHGWQVQKELTTVAGTLEAAAGKLLGRHKQLGCAAAQQDKCNQADAAHLHGTLAAKCLDHE